MTSAVNYERVSNSTDLHSIVRMTALRLMNNPYMSLKDFFEWVSQDDLDSLQSMIEDADNADNLKNLLLLAEMLASAEGLSSLSEDESIKNLNTFCAYVTCASVGRKGIADVFYEKMTFGDEYAEDTIISLKQ